MTSIQPGILAPIPSLARYLVFALEPEADPTSALETLAQIADGEGLVVGLGSSLVQVLGAEVPGLRNLVARSGPGYEVPSTPAALWCWLRGDDRGELVHASRDLERHLAPAFRPVQIIEAFCYGSGLDLTGYEDGTENPQDDAALEAAAASGLGPGLDGSSYVAVQQWVHDLDHFETLSPEEQDDSFGRRKRDNRELDQAPASAHVKRTAQESFSPEAFVLRRSMPWADEQAEGLVFVAFGHSFDAFEALLGRMVGEEDGIHDALFRFTRPVTGSYFWCPPMRAGGLDLRALDFD